jgi:signal transduction histidine kinase
LLDPQQLSNFADYTLVATDPFHAAVAELQHLPVPVGMVELDGTLVAVNVASERMMLRPAAQIVGKKVWDFAPGAEHIWDEVVAGARSGSYQGSIALATPQGPRTVSYAATLRALGERTLVVCCGMVARPADDEAKERIESLGLVAGGIAHDFNNQLVSVLAEASAARDEASLPETVRDSLRRIEAAAQRMAMLTRKLLAYAGRGRIVAEVLDPDELLKDMREELQRLVRPDALLSIQLNSTRVAVKADRGLLRECVLNLVANASESLPAAGGKIAISTAVVAPDSVTWWRLEVADQGSGMEPHVIARIFDPFFTTKADRHGLGLSAVHGTVRRLDGEITVQSERGRGTTFQIRLPVVSGVEPRERRHRPVSESGMSLRGLAVLVADDEPSVRATIRRLLERRGAKVMVAADGAEAEQLLCGEEYALVLLDVMMPEKTGYQLLPTARREQPSAKVMLMSGYTDVARGTGGEDEPDAFLEKPFTAKQMDDAVDRMLERSKRGG